MRLDRSRTQSQRLSNFKIGFACCNEPSDLTFTGGQAVELTFLRLFFRRFACSSPLGLGTAPKFCAQCLISDRSREFLYDIVCSSRGFFSQFRLALSPMQTAEAGMQPP